MNPEKIGKVVKKDGKKGEKKQKLTQEERKQLSLKASKEIDELFSELKKRKKHEEKEEEEAQDPENSEVEERADLIPKLEKMKKKRKITKNTASGGYEPEDEAALIPVDDEEDEEQPLEYGIIQSNYKRSKITNPEAPLERIDPGTGLPVYKAHLLRVGEGGGTSLCPFDCNCCF